MTAGETLRNRHADALQGFLRHPFFRQVQDGSLAPSARDAYFAYEHRFVEQAVVVLGHVLVKAPTAAARAHLVRMLGGLVTDQVAVFDRIFSVIGPPRRDMPPAVKEFCDGMTAIAADGGYAAGLAAMLAAEWTYAEVSKRLGASGVPDPLLADWFALHARPPFLEGVAWIEAELDSAVAARAAGRPEDVSDAFLKAIELEIAFHAAPLE